MEKSSYDDNIEALPTLAGLPSLDSPIKEKNDVDANSDSIELADEKLARSDSSYVDPDDEPPVYRNGEPVITTGRDVSRFAVDVRDDGDAALTLRSLVLGTMFAGMGAALSQVRLWRRHHCLPKAGLGDTAYIAH